MDDVEQSLNNHRTNGLFYTHVSLRNPKGKFNYDRYDLEDFWDKYLKYNHNDKNSTGIAEKTSTLFTNFSRCRFEKEVRG